MSHPFYVVTRREPSVTMKERQQPRHQHLQQQPFQLRVRHWSRHPLRATLSSVNDTTEDAAKVQAEVHRKLGGPRRVLIACQMSDVVRSLAHARIKACHPEFDDTAICDELTWELYGIRRPR